jgi:hypothetical protein
VVEQHQQPAPVIRVVLAEDGVLLREGLAGLLQRFGFHVVDPQVISCPVPVDLAHAYRADLRCDRMTGTGILPCVSVI